MCLIKAAFFIMLQAKRFAKRGLVNCDNSSLYCIIMCAYTTHFTMTLATLQFRHSLHRYSIVLSTEVTPRRADIKKHEELEHSVQNWPCGHAMSMLLASVPCHVDGKNVPL
jgi:hypothetical protein